MSWPLSVAPLDDDDNNLLKHLHHDNDNATSMRTRPSEICINAVSAKVDAVKRERAVQNLLSDSQVVVKVREDCGEHNIVQGDCSE